MMTSSCAEFNRIMLTKNGSSGPPSEAQSEAQSEISSINSDWSDIRSIAIKLGVQNPDDLLTERFKIDRQKLENMIKIDSSIEGWNSAEFFFETVMQATMTHISWPCRLKIGAKTKKDPHVRIVGKPEDVAKAKEQVIANLDSRGTRVIMKMDVSYTDHSYIIGRCGNNIKQIMTETATHIHFPDSNRCNLNEKSNQVSLCGSLEGVERARFLVRSSTPLLISFELPVMASGKDIPDHDTPYVQEIEGKFNIQVIFSTRPKLHSSLVLVKGSEKEATKVKEATQHLINFTCENIASQILVNMQLEISPQHHEVVKGKNNTNLLSIMERTQTKIIFPDVNDMNIKPIKKSQVTISGTIEGVYLARQQLIGNLPIALIFDYPGAQPDTSEIINLSSKYGVFVTWRQKQRQSSIAVVVKGVEKHIDKVYEARHEILNLTTPIVKPDIPETYYSPKDNDSELNYKNTLTSLLSSYPESPLTPSAFQIHNNNVNSAQSNYINSHNNNGYQKFQGTPTGIPVVNPKYLQTKLMHGSNGGNSLSNGNNNFLNVPNQIPSINLSPRNNSINNTSGYQSFSSSSTSLEQGFAPYHTSSTCNIPAMAASSSRGHYSPDSTINDTGCNNNINFINRIGRRLSDGGIQNLREYRAYLENMKQLQQPNSFDLDAKRVVGFKAMERPPQGEVRTPNSNWLGLGLSRTSPAPLETADDMGAWNRNGNNNILHGNNSSGIPNNISPYNLGITTGIVESNRRMQLSQHKDIHSLLTALGLDHYIKTFVLNEIDLEVFASLTEENLIELGIKAFGARKKLLCAIYTLSAHYQIFNLNNSPRFSAAPGAERKNRW